MFHFSHIYIYIYKKLEKRLTVEFLIKKKISSLIAACSFLYVRFFFVGTYCSRYETHSASNSKDIDVCCIRSAQKTVVKTT